jgi:hypothetical protein
VSDYSIDERAVRELRQLARKMLRATFTGPGVTCVNTPDQLSVSFKPPGRPRPSTAGGSGGGDESAWLEMIGAAGGGVYLAKRWLVDLDGFDPSADSFTSVGAVTAGLEQMVVINLAERGRTTNALVNADAIGKQHRCWPTGLTCVLDGSTYDVWLTDSYTSKGACSSS